MTFNDIWMVAPKVKLFDSITEKAPSVLFNTSISDAA